MLTNLDLQKIDDLFTNRFKPLISKVDKIEIRLNKVEMRLEKMEKKLDVFIHFFDDEIHIYEKRVKRIETHLDLSPL